MHLDMINLVSTLFHQRNKDLIYRVYLFTFDHILCRPDMHRHFVGPDLDPLIVFLKKFFEKDVLKINQQKTKCMKNYTACKEFKFINCKVNLRLIVGG